MGGHTGFRRMSLTSQGCVTLHCRLLVIVCSLCLVVLVFEGCPELLRGGVTLQCRLLVIVQLLHLVILVFTPLCLNCCYFFYLKSCLLFMRSAWLVTMVSLAVTEVLKIYY